MKRIRTMFVALMMLMLSMTALVSSLSTAEESGGMTYITEFEGRLGWKYFSLPFSDSITVDNLIIRFDGMDYSLDEACNDGIVYNHIGQFDNVNKRWDYVEILVPGLAHCIYVYKEGVQLYTEDAHPDGGASITILYKGWNYLGIPRSSPVEKSNISVIYDGIKYSFGEAVGSDIILNFIYWYDNDWVAHIVDTLMPGEVYIMYNYKDEVKLVVPRSIPIIFPIYYRLLFIFFLLTTNNLRRSQEFVIYKISFF
ncbi:hypothetical protein MBGDN05_00425, partial [Thermoplasmatales archaeon SCGC AB-539-N05]